MDCDHEDEHGGRSPTGSKSSFREDELQNNSVLSASTFQHTGKTFLFTFNTSVSRKIATNSVVYLFDRVI